MPSSSSSLTLIPPRALPRADAASPLTDRGRRDRWGSRRRWPFGPVPTAISVALHAVALVAIVWALATPPEPEAIGAQVYAVLTPDLGELTSSPELDVPEELPELEELDLPAPQLETALEPEPCLDPLCELEPLPTESGLSLSIVSLRVHPRPAVAAPTPPAPVVVVPPRATPRPVAAPAPRPRGAMPRGRLRPLVKPIRYPAQARMAGIQGRARVAMTIDPQGSVVDAQLLASSGHAILDHAALASARSWRFAPPGTYRRAAQTFRFALN